MPGTAPLAPMILAAVALFSTCAERPPSAPSGSPDASGMGRLTILLTDHHLDGVQEVHVWIHGISTELRGGGVISFDRQLGDVELLSLHGESIEVVNNVVPSGTYEYVELGIDESRSRIVESGLTKTLSVPAGSARVRGPFEVRAGESTTITLDFDAEKSLSRLPDGSWALDPVVVVKESG